MMLVADGKETSMKICSDTWHVLVVGDLSYMLLSELTHTLCSMKVFLNHTIESIIINFTIINAPTFANTLIMASD